MLKKWIMKLGVALLSTVSVAQVAGLDVQVFESHEALGRACAERIVQRIKENNKKGKRTVLGLVTGSTPIPVYQTLLQHFNTDPNLDLSRVITFNLDEYLDLQPNHKRSYHFYMFHNLFVDRLLWSQDNPRGIRLENIHLPKTLAERASDLSANEKEWLQRLYPDDDLKGGELSKDHEYFIMTLRAHAYEEAIKELGPIDIQILGIGENGHIGFAEPGSALDSECMVIKLSDSTREANARFFDGEIDRVPRFAMTMGIGTIMRANEIILMATGEKKSWAIDACLHGSVTEQVPASVLQNHHHVSFFLDREVKYTPVGR